MPEKKIPCKDCELEKNKIEELGNAKVIECVPIEGDPDWCKIVWRYIE